MIDITSWTHIFMQKLNETFKNRVWFVGLQGSYGRGEATEKSDIDIVVILDELSANDIQSYHAMLDHLPHRELICGFLSGKEEIMNWDPADLFQFYHDTTPVKGSMDEILNLIDNTAVRRAIKIGVCNIYHGCVHNMVHEKSKEIIQSLYKSASFVLQAIYFLKTGNYIRNQVDILQLATPQDRIIIETFLSIKNDEPFDFGSVSESLFLWAQKQIHNLA